ncbi:MAG TPA: hypothetical protein VGR15_07645 [Bacteroidota bacterium]|jgi:hypothetical protein|nr:hypothetical protein [Bacteroidota bacterium]
MSYYFLLVFGIGLIGTGVFFLSSGKLPRSVSISLIVWGALVLLVSFG